MNSNKKPSSKLLRFWKILGPGLVTGASDVNVKRYRLLRFDFGNVEIM